jgi:hypothetical protein
MLEEIGLIYSTKDQLSLYPNTKVKAFNFEHLEDVKQVNKYYFSINYSIINLCSNLIKSNKNDQMMTNYMANYIFEIFFIL